MYGSTFCGAELPSVTIHDTFIPGMNSYPISMSFFAACTLAILSGFSYASSPLHVRDITSSDGSTFPVRTSCTVDLTRARASSFFSSRILSKRSVSSLLWRSNESERRISYPLTRSSSCASGHTILPTYLFFIPCVNMGSRIFSNSRVPPSREYLSAILVPNSTDPSRSWAGDCMNTESVSE